MLGTEYNWLISSRRQPDGLPQIGLAKSGLMTLAVAVFCFLCVALRAEPPHRVLMREAAAAAKAKDTPLLIAKLEAVRTLRPDYPRVISNLARAYTAAGRADEAMTQLRKLAAMGLDFDIAKDDALTALRDRADFAALTTAFAANRAPVGRDETAWAITGMNGIIESIATHPTTLENFFGDVRNRCIWYRDVAGPSGVMRKFSADSDGLLGVFALKISPDGRTLWAASSALAEMTGYTAADKGRAFLAAYDLGTRKLAGTYPLPPGAAEQGHVLGDFVLAPDGAIYVSDSTAPIIWRLAPKGDQLGKWLEHPDFVSLQGLAFGADGRSLIVADYANGIWRVNTATKEAVVLKTPANSTLFGIDGIYAAPDALIAVQNGMQPQRILRIDLDAAGAPRSVRVLAQGHPKMTDASLGQLINGRLHVIADSGWELFEKPGAAPAPRNVTILSIPTD